MTFHPVFIAIMVVALLTVGVYIGISGFITQYAVDTSDSSAGAVACAATPREGVTGAPIVFAASGLPAGSLPYWSSTDGRTEVSGNRLSALFSSVGKKTVSLFWFSQNRWNRTTCSVQVR